MLYESNAALATIGDGFVARNAVPAYIFMKLRQEGDVPPYPTTPGAKRTTVATALRLGYRPEYSGAMFA